MKEAAGLLQEQQKEIINLWVKKVREELPAPNQTTDPVLRNHLPLLLQDIIRIMKRYDDFEVTAENYDYSEMLDTSTGHGRHRSSSSGYDLEQVLKEYIILHRILTQMLRARNLYSTTVADLLKYIIENSMLYAVVAFNNSLQEIRQKIVGTLAHDIRNPASAAYLSMGMLQQEDSPDRFKKIRDMSRNSIKRCLALLEDLLDSVTTRAGEGITMDFSERDILPFVRSVYGEASEIYSNEFILKSDDEPIFGVFDSAMIRRVLENIVNNAVKYGRTGGPITISVENDSEQVKISIHNQGEPISTEQQKEMFEFLRTSKGKGPGRLKSWGMGLSLVKIVAEAHGGSLDVESTQENGTTFILVLKKYANEPGSVSTALNFTYGHSEK